MDTNLNKGYFFIRSGKRYLRVDNDEICYIEGLKDYVQINTINGKHVTHLSLRVLEESLPSEKFIRVHRSYLINKDKIQSVTAETVQVENIELPIGISFRETVLERVVQQKLLKK